MRFFFRRQRSSANRALIAADPWASGRFAVQNPAPNLARRRSLRKAEPETDEISDLIACSKKRRLIGICKLVFFPLFGKCASENKRYFP
jgi:hypothetical protein